MFPRTSSSIEVVKRKQQQNQREAFEDFLSNDNDQHHDESRNDRDSDSNSNNPSNE
jgi:hypothetical protein